MQNFVIVRLFAEDQQKDLWFCDFWIFSEYYGSITPSGNYFESDTNNMCIDNVTYYLRRVQIAFAFCEWTFAGRYGNDLVPDLLLFMILPGNNND